MTGAGSDSDAITVTLGTTITINDPVNTITAGSGVTQLDTHTVTVPRGSITGSMTLDAGQGDDRVTLTGASAGLNVTVNGGTGQDEFIIRNGTVANVTLDGGAGTDSVVNRAGLASAPNLLSVETNVDRPVLFIPGFGGTNSADLTPAGVREWELNRGRRPDQLALEPLQNSYSDIEVTLDNAGYRLGVTSFTVKWDWRVPVAETNDTADDGRLDDVTLSRLQSEQTTPTWRSGVDYLSWYLGQATTAWQTLTGGMPAEVDFITHSTGGLIARSYLQSAAYQANDATLDSLPEVHTLIQVGVPSQGTGQSYDFLNNDFSLKPASRILARVLDQAYSAVAEQGAVINNPDGTTITAASLAAEADPRKAFIGRYISTLRDLLSTQAFFDDNQDGLAQYRALAESEGGNPFLLDLNAGTGLTAFGSTVDATYIVYGNEADTAELVTTHTGPVFSQTIQNEQLPFDQLFGHFPSRTEVWTSYSDVLGDGSVTFTSSAGPYVGDSRFQLIEIIPRTA